jgi:hypothetical protein
MGAAGILQNLVSKIHLNIFSLFFLLGYPCERQNKKYDGCKILIISMLAAQLRGPPS